MGKWCMYLSVNGANNNSVIVLLISDDLDGAWSYMGEVVYSGFNNENYTSTDYTKVFPEATVVAEKYNVRRDGQMSYSLNAIDAAVTYDKNGDLWMSYGSWYGGIYMLKLDEATGLRDYTYTYENNLRDGNGAAYTGAVTGDGGFAVISDEYLGLHIAGGYQTPMGGEGSYFLKIGDWWYLFLSYGGLAPDAGYNMRVFRSATLTGFNADGDFVGYKDAAGNSPIMLNAITTMNGTKLNGTNGYDSQVGVRIMSGYTWSWWDYSYIAQGHNSAFVDGRKAYLVYHNKYTDGTIIHVLKVHELLVNADGWLVTSPFESTVQTTDVSSADELATGLLPADIAGTYGAVYMTRNNGTYSDVCRESKITLNSDGTISGDNTGEWTYDKQTGGFTIRTNVDNRVHTGYLIYQNLEGTNIRTLVFTAINTSGESISQYTYWGYKYPTAKQQAEYLINSYAIPDRATTDAVIPSGALSNGLWDDVKVTFSLEPSTGTLTATYEGGSIAIRIGLATEGTIEVDEVTAGKTFTPVNTDNGVSISFDYSNYDYDWTNVLVGNDFAVNLSTIEYLATDIYEGGATNSGLVGSAPNHEIFYTNDTARATISFNKDGSICFYLNDVLALTYASATLFNDNATTVGTVCNAILSEFEAGTVRSAYLMQNVVIGEQVSAAGTTELYQINDGYYTVDYAAAQNAVNTNTAWWAGALGETTLPVGNAAVIYRYTRSHNFTDNAIQMHKAGDAEGIWATLYPFGPLNEWPNDWQSAGTATYYLNGELLADTTGINTGNVEGATTGFWIGTFVISFMRYENTLYIICDFERDETYNLVCIYTINNVSEALTIRFSGYCADITNCTLAHSTSISYSATAPEEEHVHNYTESSRVENACTGDLVTYTCSCGDSYTATDFTDVVGHKYTVSATEATCTEPAKLTYTCSVCGDKFTAEVTPALGHDYGEPEWEWKGYTSATATFTCTRCDHTETETAVITSEVTTPATCEGTGVRTYTATVTFGEEQFTDTETETVAALGHDYENVQPTWAWDGYTSAKATFQCTRCDHTETETAVITSEVTTPATCEGTGVRTYTATVTFGEEQFTDTETETIDALGHDYTDVQPTWAWEGYASATATFKYTRCDHTETETAVITSEVTTEATCEGAGVRTYTATVTFGDKQFTDTETADIAVLGHEWGTPVYAGTTLSVSCTRADSVCSATVAFAAGDGTGEITALTATFDDTVFTVTLPNDGMTANEEGYLLTGWTVGEESYATNVQVEIAPGENVTFTAVYTMHKHSYTAVAEVPATCEKEGVKAHFTCTCGRLFVPDGEGYTEVQPADLAISALGHSWDEGSVTKPATCTEKGVKTFACTRDGCDKTRTEEIPAAGHTYSEEWLHDADGHWHKCESCDAVTQTEAHVWGDWTQTKPATCTEKGVKTRTCSACDATETADIAALGHEWDEGSVTKPATCTEKGVKTFACTRDGCDKTRTEEIPAAGHTYSEEWLHDADGHWHKCESCDAVTQTEAHVWGDWTTTKEATATENGSRSRECSVCGEEQSEVIPATGTQPAPDDPDGDPDPAPDDDPDGSVSDEGLSDGAIAGIVIGCTVGALAIAYVVLAILFKKGIVKGAFFSRIFPFIK